jgi:hypothetical protein
MFKDPLATLPYLGGYFPNHLGLMIYSCLTYFLVRPNIICPNMSSEQIEDEFDEVKWMMVSHLIYLLSLIIMNFLPKTNPKTMYKRELLIFVNMSFYLFVYLYLQSQAFKGLSKETMECINSDHKMEDLFLAKKLYVEFEVFQFYAIALTLCFYMVFSRVFFKIKEKMGHDLMDDPFTQLALSEEDYLNNDNQIMYSFNLLNLNAQLNIFVMVRALQKDINLF